MAYTIGGWKGVPIKLLVRSALYSVKPLEDERMTCGISIKVFGVNSFSFSVNEVFDNELSEEPSSLCSNIEVR